jgi:hypothetical protein
MTSERLIKAREQWRTVQTMRDTVWAGGAELTSEQLAEVQAAMAELNAAETAEFGSDMQRLLDADLNSRTPLYGGRS